MIWRPTGVEPVNDTTSTSGCVVSSAPTAVSDDVSTFTTPAGMSVASAISLPSASVAHGRVGRALEHDGAPGRERGRKLRQRELDRVVVRRDRADDAGGLLLDPAVVPARERVALAEVFDELVALERDRRTSPRRRSGLRAADRWCSRSARRPRCTRISRSGSSVVAQRLLELAQAPHPERVVAGPFGGVERAPGGADRPPRVGDGRVGGDAEHRSRSTGRRSRTSRRRRPAPTRRRSAAALRASSSPLTLPPSVPARAGFAPSRLR